MEGKASEIPLHRLDFLFGHAPITAHDKASPLCNCVSFTEGAPCEYTITYSPLLLFREWETWANQCFLYVGLEPTSNKDWTAEHVSWMWQNWYSFRHTPSPFPLSLSLSLLSSLLPHVNFPSHPSLTLPLSLSLSLSNSSCQLFYTDNPEVGSEEEEEEKEEWRQCELHEEVCSYFKWNGVPIIMSITHDNWELHRIPTPLREMDSKTKSHNLRCSQQNNGCK